MRTFNDAHKEALSAGCPLSQIHRRIEGKRYERRPGKDGDETVSHGTAIVSVPAGEWRPALLAKGWTGSDDGGCEVEVDRGRAYDPKALGLEARPTLAARLGAGWEVFPRGDFELAVHASGLAVDVGRDAADLAPIAEALASGVVGRHRLVDGQLLQGAA